MADFNALQAIINAYIKRNGVQAITGQILNGVLTGMVNALGKGYTVAGAASPTTDPGTMTGPLAYIAYTAGTYTHFDNIVVEQGEVSMLIYNEAEWHKEVLFSLAAQATVDDNIGVPSVGVSFVDGILTFNFRNMKGEPGENGQDGDPAGFGTISASISGGVGTPGVSVQSSGPDTAKNIAFQFTNLKGETGVTSCVVTVDNTTGNPSCAVSLVGQELHLDFSGLKGAQGNTGSSVDYPFTIVNNLTTDDPTQALSAAMGVQLESEVSQLEAKVTEKLDAEIGVYQNYFIETKLNPVGGLVQYDANTAVSDFIPVTPGTTITFKHKVKNPATTLVYVYDSTKSGISWVAGGRIAASTTTTEVTATLVESAAYIRVCVLRANVDGSMVVDANSGDIIYRFISEQDGIEQKVDSFHDDYESETIESSWESGYGLNLSGQKVSYTGSSVSDFIPVIEGDFYLVYSKRVNNTLSASLPYLPICGYASEDESTFIENAFPFVDSKLCINIPKGVHFIRVAHYTISSVPVAGGLYACLGIIHYKSKNALEAEGKKYIPKSTYKNNTPQALLVDNKNYINYQTSEQTNGKDVNFGIFNVEEGDHFWFDISDRTTDGWGNPRFFDANRKYVSGIDCAGMTEVDIIVPFGCKYLAIAYKGGYQLPSARDNNIIENPFEKRYIESVDYDSNDYSYTMVTDFIKGYNGVNQPYPFRADVPNFYELTWTPKSDAASQVLTIKKSDGTDYNISLGATVDRYKIYNTIPGEKNLVKVTSIDASNNRTVILSKGICMDGKLRGIYVEGMFNFRDIGGWESIYGGRVKYDKAFRSCEPYSATSPDTQGNITEAGIDEVINRLGIEVELDFGGTSSTSPLEDYLEFVHGDEYQIIAYEDMFLPEQKVKYKNCFEVILNSVRAGKKILFHCSAGADRTGTLAFLVNGILGVSESDLAKDYELTSFVYLYRKRNGTNSTTDGGKYKTMVDYLKANYAGNTFHEKVVAMALDFGITQSEIEEFRELMLQK